MKLFRRSIDKENGESGGIRAKLCIVTVLSVLVLVAAVPMAAGDWYFKPGYPNYAPSGMPDFDQKQDAWQAINAGPNGLVESAAIPDDVQIIPLGPAMPYQKAIAPGQDCTLQTPPGGDDQIVWVFCGPTAVANCFWWFDSKYADPTGWPGDGNDIFPLVQDYGAGDDHLAANVQPLVCDLANRMLTCSRGTTDVHDMEDAIDNWLNGTGLSNKLYEHTEKAPDFYWIEEEIERSQDVILLLGFWAEYEPYEFHRCGGHYVTCAGVDSENMTIAFSDPFFDNAVAGGQGHIVPNPHPAGYSATFHNDANRISHDYYNVTLSSSPGGNWALPDYPVSVNRSLVQNFQEDECWEGPIHTEIEYAVVISPRCTPGIEVNKTVWNGTAWVKEVTANVSDTLRFRLWVHNNGTCCNLTGITVVDILSDSLNYSDNATVDGVPKEPDWVAGNQFGWNFAGPLAPCQNITIEFNANVVECGVDTNIVNASAWCDETMVSDEDSVTVYAPCPGWYWKDYNGEEEGGYMPDFDQNQDFTGDPAVEQNYCAPTAEANSLWWFAQKYPDREVVPAGMTPQALIQELAYLMDTNGQRTGTTHFGTYVDDEQAGIDEYLILHNLTDLLYEHTELKPEFDWIEAEIERCQDVKLDLGFYEVIEVIQIEPGVWEIHWWRIGGHAVTAAGVNSENFMIAVSDPDADNAEFGSPGVIRGPNHNHGGVPFRDPAYDHTQHNDGVSASHDIYNVAPSISPGGKWELTDEYWRNVTVAHWYYENNGGSWTNVTYYYGGIPPEPGEIHTEIEAAVVVSPKCTPAIEVNKTVWDPVNEAWVKEVTANVSDTVRFRLWVHNNGTCCNLTDISVMDTLSDSLNYSDNATVNGASQEPVPTGPKEYVWNFAGPLAPCQNITIEFDARVVECGNDTNVVNATGWCNVTMVSDADSVKVTVPCGICGNVNGDLGVDMGDVILLANYVGYPGSYTITNKWAANVNGDSGIDMGDVILLANYVGYPGLYTLNCKPVKD